MTSNNNKSSNIGRQQQELNITISELLNCGICGKILNEPRVIPCSHSFCSLCISNILYSTLKLQKQQGGEEVEVGQEEQGIIKFKCPICKSEHQNIQSSTQLPKNYFLENILRSLHLNLSSSNNNNNNKKKEIRYCEYNDSNEATIYCAKCETYVCSGCFKSVHLVGKLKQHKPQSLDDVNTTIPLGSKVEPPKCTKHPKYHEDLYCESCHSPICQMCLIDDHQNNGDEDRKKHKVISASKYAEIIKSKLLQRCDLILTDSSKLNDELQTRNSQITNYHLQITDLQNKIADLQSRLESENQKKSNLQHKLNDLNSIHQIIITAINQYFNDYDLINQQTVNHCSADISMFYEKLYSLKSPLSLNLFDPLPLPLTITDDIWSLNPNSFKGDASSYKLISNKHFEKLKADHCAITCIESIKHTATPAHYQWQIQYQYHSSVGWLLIGLHSNSSASTQRSFSDKEFIGWNISCKSGTNPTNNFSYFYGVFTSIGTLQAESEDILKFSLNTKSKTIRLEHPSWHVETTLQSDFEHYYLHFNSHSASFKLLSCSLLLDTN